MTILVCGGAGYIGSHTVEELISEYEVIILDNLSTGLFSLINPKAKFVKGNLGDRVVLDKIFSENTIDAVFHFAANSLVEESVRDPIKYYNNNVGATIILLEKMLEYGIKKFVFSSSAATYGVPSSNLITENTPTNPINPYGRSKLMVEQILNDMSITQGLQFIILRYFNAAGAHISGKIGESHEPETHLIPIVLEHFLGKRNEIIIYGNDYETKDGTCVRDYIHVSDIAKAHILAYNALKNGNIVREVFNLGNGKGYSVKEIIEVSEKIVNKSAKIKYSNRRVGDPANLVASSKKIEKLLGWKPEYNLEDIISSAWNWHSKN